ncbi:hypothetical protein Y032_0003g1278 [Ancylostoma ceylanicum]|nr:hypothetical protein Y032_0003g1278 [Ancylostoma ceylanicum]
METCMYGIDDTNLLNRKKKFLTKHDTVFASSHASVRPQRSIEPVGTPEIHRYPHSLPRLFRSTMTSFQYLVVVSVLKSKAYACIATVSPEDTATTTATTAATTASGTNAAAASLSGLSAVPFSSLMAVPGGGILAVIDSGATTSTVLLNNAASTATSSNVVGTTASATTQIVSGGGTTAILVGGGGTETVSVITASSTGSIATTLSSVASPGTITTTTVSGTTTYVPGSPVSDANCNTWCPTTYKDDCNNMATVCATAVEAAAVVATTGTECRLTWTCPAGTAPYYYVYAPPTPQAYPTSGDYAQCFPPPNSFWYLPDGVTQINGMACQSPP